MSTLARMGIVFLRSTMPWNSCSSRSRSVLRTTSSMSVMTSENGAVGYCRSARDPFNDEGDLENKEL